MLNLGKYRTAELLDQDNLPKRRVLELAKMNVSTSLGKDIITKKSLLNLNDKYKMDRYFQIFEAAIDTAINKYNENEEETSSRIVAPYNALILFLKSIKSTSKDAETYLQQFLTTAFFEKLKTVEEMADESDYQDADFVSAIADNLAANDFELVSIKSVSYAEDAEAPYVAKMPITSQYVEEVENYRQALEQQRGEEGRATRRLAEIEEFNLGEQERNFPEKVARRGAPVKESNVAANIFKNQGKLLSVFDNILRADRDLGVMKLQEEYTGIPIEGTDAQEDTVRGLYKDFNTLSANFKFKPSDVAYRQLIQRDSDNNYKYDELEEDSIETDGRLEAERRRLMDAEPEDRDEIERNIRELENRIAENRIRNNILMRENERIRKMLIVPSGQTAPPPYVMKNVVIPRNPEQKNRYEPKVQKPPTRIQEEIKQGRENKARLGEPAYKKTKVSGRERRKQASKSALTKALLSAQEFPDLRIASASRGRPRRPQSVEPTYAVPRASSRADRERASSAGEAEYSLTDLFG